MLDKKIYLCISKIGEEAMSDFQFAFFFNLSYKYNFVDKCKM